MRQLKRQFSRQHLEELSLPIVSKLRQRLSGVRTVLAYYSLPDEVCTHSLLDDLLAEGKTVLLPKILDDRQMELRRYTGTSDLREEETLHLQEPVGAAFTDFARIDAALIPGMAFDAQGRRLGRGRGYYDRFLPSLPSSCVLIGVCFDFQLVSEVPVGETDMPVDEVIS